MERFGIHSKRVLVNDKLVEATILISGEKIERVLPGKVNEELLHVTDFGNLVIMPGLIDSHVHVNEPGRTDWEGFDHATKAAAAGGITTIVDMPLNSAPVTTTKENFQIKLKSTKGKCHVNCGFWGGLIPESHDDLEELLDAGVLGIKIFLTHSGIDDFPNVTKDDLVKASAILKDNDCLVLAHCEIESENELGHLQFERPHNYEAYLLSRPRSWENAAIQLMIENCKEFGIRTHIVHLSSSDSIEQIQRAKKQGLPLTVETCPHYLYFNSETIPDGSPAYKCAPPIREKDNNEKLWQELESGGIDFIVTDHSPAPAELKEMDSGVLNKAWGGISSLQLSLPIMWTLAESRGMSLSKLSKLMSENVAKFLGLENVKGKVAAGFDADIVIWDPDDSFTVEEKGIFHKHKLTPYLGEQLKGLVRHTYVNGKHVFNDGKFEQLNQGKIILKDSNE